MEQLKKNSADLMDVSAVARRLNVKRSTVYDIIAAGRLRCYRIGIGRGTIRVSEAMLQEYLERAESEPEDPIPLRSITSPSA